MRKFGTFEGVFTPSILTIIGVILFLRLGWVVGSVGLTHALLIVGLAHLATISTGLSLAAMATNTRVKAGGFYALISHSLGLEAGGAVGIPLYLSQALGAALYIIGFTELWTFLFPFMNATVVSATVLVVLVILSAISAKLAMKVQYGIMLVISAALVSFLLGPDIPADARPGLQKLPTETGFWPIFAIFFPAVTGIGSGAAMSGDLKDPRRSLPWGILSAVLVGLVIYIGCAVLLSEYEPDRLRSDAFIMLSAARWPVLVIAGVMGATLSSALGTIVGAPRILAAMAENRLVPVSGLLARKSRRGEPLNALFVTLLLIEFTMLAGNLDSVASLLTMFFLITYSTLNMAVFLEKSLGIPSFRPAFDIPRIIPLVGGVWCLVIMYLINPLFATVALLSVAGIYLYLLRREMSTGRGDLRASLFLSLAEWAARMSARYPSDVRNWKPDLLVPLEEPGHDAPLVKIASQITYPVGTIRFFTIRTGSEAYESMKNRLRQWTETLFRRGSEENGNDEEVDGLEERMQQVVGHFTSQGLFASGSIIDTEDLLRGMSIVTQTMKSMYFPPNTLLISMSRDISRDGMLEQMLALAVRARMGIIVFCHPQGIEEARTLNLWLRVGSPNINLAILTALQISRNNGWTIRIITVVNSDSERDKATAYLRRLMQRSRMPRSTSLSVFNGTVHKAIVEYNQTAMHIFGLGRDLDCREMHSMVEFTDAPVLFIRDSGHENALAG